MTIFPLIYSILFHFRYVGLSVYVPASHPVAQQDEVITVELKENIFHVILLHSLKDEEGSSYKHIVLSEQGKLRCTSYDYGAMSVV